ncbi:OmpA family protein [Polyangium jinanense]|uniref:OmpA family protein n=1 Tax=Polyangium jinanense TaxID=2829994 RepID=A0A9X4AT69_9BACT|nr:OmpA family protein [Polyangium jinanense]MDC3983884.1 OmpA family protein [Polyangium jinanense]
MRSLLRILPLSLAALLALAAPARADDIALPRFQPAFAGDRMLGVQSPYAAGDFTFHGMLLVDYARNPYVLKTADGATASEVVGRQLFLHANATYSMWNRLAVNLDVPVALLQTGDADTSPTTADFGDIRLGARVRLYGGYEAPLQVGIGGFFWIPTGTGAYVTDSYVRGLPQLLLGGQLRDRWVWSFAVGPEIRDKRTTDDGVVMGTAITGGAGIAILLGEDRALQIGPELDISQVLLDASSQNRNIELSLQGRYRFLDDFEAGMGIGAGLSEGVGTPLFRVVAMVAYSPFLSERLRDSDGDGVLNDRDACPEVRGDRSVYAVENGCPSVYRKRANDADGDDVIDDQDACPRVYGIPQSDETRNGCPLDDAEEAALLEQYRDNRPDSKGDTDGDGLGDAVDACPEEKGVPSEVAAKNGCPEAVRVTEGEIVLLRELLFDAGRATLRPSSRQMLEEVAEVLLQHPEITKIEVQGHTDNRGTLPRNDALALQRAQAVRDLLVRRSIDPKRIVLKAFGPNAPVATNTTPEGRQRNRRATFVILERKPAPAPPSPSPSGVTPTP